MAEALKKLGGDGDNDGRNNDGREGGNVADGRGGGRGAQFTYTELPGVGHNAWTPAWQTKGLWDWLLAQKKR
jgi:hypothetical protein